MAKLDYGPLAEVVTQWLEAWWSPEEIAHRLPIEFPHDPMMRVSYESIYQSIYVQGRGELRRELARCLRSGREPAQGARRRQARSSPIHGMVLISDRPAEIEDRAVPGHWEGDLLIGKGGQSQIGLWWNAPADTWRWSIFATAATPPRWPGPSPKTVRRLPGELVRSITWDQGREWASTPASAWPPESTSTSAIRIVPGNEGPTRTPTV